MPTWLPLLLGFLTAIGPLSTDMYLPAFPAIEQGLGVPHGSAEITLASWFVGLAFGQLAQGTLSDRFGRRRPLMVGLTIYVVGSVGCALSVTVSELAFWRAVAAFGGSASMVLPRAVVRDLAEGLAAARLMSKLMLVMGAAPILAPGLGGMMLSFGGWQDIFWFGAIYGVISLVLVTRWLPETLTAERRQTLSVMGLVRQYAEVLKDRNFLAHVGMAGACMFMVFAYIGGGSAVYQGMYGLTPSQFGILFGVGAAAFILCSQLNPLLLQRLGAKRVVELASLVMLGSTAVLVLMGWTGWGGIAGIFLPALPAMACSAMVMPNAAVGALARHPTRAGSASAMMGTLQFGLAAMSGLLVGVFSDGTALPMTGLMFLGAVCVVISAALRPKVM
ncbi:multidrug effflux MFS transporter [Acetobacteraceae bacterium H6797]|nr:multidrug effflux MFS transporter [Acetobacteraceae bacterium H6797]